MKATPVVLKCASCDAEFTCGIDGDSPCWCSTGFPALLPVPDSGAACLCPECLKKKIAERQGAGRDRAT
jgi:hypothetical protein